MNRIQDNLIQEIMERDDSLNEWEAKFVDDLFNRDPDTLTTRQNHKLIQIHHKAVFER